jgi:hypothetical protein
MNINSLLTLVSVTYTLTSRHNYVSLVKVLFLKVKTKDKASKDANRVSGIRR